MKDVAEFQDSIEAIAYRDELVAKGIDAVVETFSLPRWGTKFLVKVPEDQYAKVFPDESDVYPVEDDPIVKCPYCGSPDVNQKDDGCLLGTLKMLLVIPAVIFVVRRKTSGILFECKPCRREFRFKL